MTADNNTTVAGDGDFPDDSFEAVVAPTIFAFIIVFGIVGNGLLIYTVMANATMRTVSNIFLFSLTIGDLLVILICAPLRMMLYLLGDTWPFGRFLCTIYEFVINLSQGVSIFTLTALAGDRFVAIVFPLKRSTCASKKRAVVVALLVWLLAFALALPDMVTSRLITVHETANESFRVCLLFGRFFNSSDALAEEILYEQEKVRSHPYVMTRYIMNFLVYFAVPLVVVTVMYVAIAVSLIRNASAQASRSVKLGGAANWKKLVGARRRVARIVLVIVVLFVICWTPRYIILFVTNYGSNRTYEEVREIKFFLSIALPFLNSCINPPALYCMSSDFRRYFNHYLFGCCCKSRRLGYNQRNSDVGLANSVNYVDRSNLATSYDNIPMRTLS